MERDTSIKMCPELVNSSGTPEGPETSPWNLRWLSYPVGGGQNFVPQYVKVRLNIKLKV